MLVVVSTQVAPLTGEVEVTLSGSVVKKKESGSANHVP